MPEMPASRRAEIDDLLWDETATAAVLRAAGRELAAEVDRLRMVAARQSVLLKRAHDEARTALAYTGGA
ncbi:hypothetical protein ACH4FX_38955 [Streptomyces sp. NPDC018019]|uniref:hypothetical protein n=1 Tax=Streptomyces sp. NPDC018019 TaxID=3365030 RepID=UPI0037AE71C8